jgi:hypothetical protein
MKSEEGSVDSDGAMLLDRNKPLEEYRDLLDKAVRAANQITLSLGWNTDF